MSKKLFIALCFALMMLVGAVMAQPPGDPDAAAPGEVITGIVEFDGAYVYVGPDFAYDIIGQINQDDSVVVLGRRGDFFYAWDGRQWLEIEFAGRTAWVYARLIRTSIPFNSIPPTGRPLPRNRDGRVPEDFNLTDNICTDWTGTFTQSGDFTAGDTVITVTYPPMDGANVYSVIVISPTGVRRAFDSTTTTAEIILADLPTEGGVYTWRVAPYWTNQPERYAWQQLCLLETGGTFVRPGSPATPAPTRYYGWYSGRPPMTPTPEPPFVK